jgi:hypothetical protein
MRSAYDLDSDPAEAWRLDAACFGCDPDWWELIGKETEANRMAKRICAGCPVTADCKDMADRTHSWGLIYGGKAYYRPTRRATPQWAICARCMTAFERRAVWAKFCSDRCRIAHNSVRQAAKRRAGVA